MESKEVVLIIYGKKKCTTKYFGNAGMSLKNDSVKRFVTWQKFNNICQRTLPKKAIRKRETFRILGL